MIRRIAGILLALALGLALAEIAARVALLAVDVWPSAARSLEERDEARKERLREQRAGTLDPSYALHPYVGFVDGPTGAPTEDLRELGFFGPLPREPRADRFVVGVFGGSVAGMFAADGGPERAFASLAAGREIAVLSLGLGGYKQPQPLMALTWLLALGVHLDLVLLVDGFNEVVLAPVENVPHGVSLTYPRSWGALLADLDVQPRARRLLAEVGVLGDWREALAPWERSRSGIASLASRLAGRAIDARVVDARTELAHERVAAGSGYQVTGPRWNPADEEPLFAALASLWREGSLQMSRLCAANGIRFVHVLQPNQYGGRKEMGDEERRIAFNPRHPYAAPARKGYPLLRAAGAELREQSVEWYDLSDLFADLAEPLYVDDCCHFGERGNAILADALAERVR